jgi:hypothetical protein
LGVVHARVEEPDEEGELEGEVLGNVVEDDAEGGGFEEVEETDWRAERLVHGHGLRREGWGLQMIQ